MELIRKYLWLGILVLCAVALGVRFAIHENRLGEERGWEKPAEIEPDVVSVPGLPRTLEDGRRDPAASSGDGDPVPEELQLEGPKAEFEAALKHWESAHREVLRDVVDERGNQSIVIAMPAPPNLDVAGMLAQAMRDIPEDSRRKAAKELQAFAGDYIRFTGGTYGKDYWDRVGEGPTYRILYIKVFEKDKRLSVTFTDTLGTPAEFWREGMETAALTGAQTPGRLTPSEAKERFGHLFEIEGFDELQALEGSPERARELMQQQQKQRE